ncbi:hypothetical protein D0865_11662 [Hortaea werneckii]|uniref:Heterokaryon incompatibility domain-containing protein n=1 Tax=Hortaea werneckii TaxID=91943 RepID=A0A3M7BSZ8_HORWE|nr:hypothetical protein D0865_11662 [Hortaea werneckii]
MAFPAFCYSSLPQPETDIRLLSFTADAQDSDTSTLELNIENFALQNAPPYAAMSYTWGDPPAQETILIHGHTFTVRWNCRYMLRQLKKHRPYGYFWVDAICINQDDLAEKNCQVQMMGEIYEHAECVIACLGEHADDSHLLFEHLGDLEAAMRAHGVAQEKIDFARGRSLRVPTFAWLGTIGRVVAYDLCNALDALMRRRYWTRVWIVQELRLARKVRLLCGSHETNLDVLLVLCNEMETCTAYGHGIEFYKDEWQDKPNPPCHASEDHITHHNQIHDFTRIKRYLAGGLDSLYSVLGSYRSSGASDKRDHIYGFRRLIEWPPGRPAIQVDYSVPPLVVAERLMTYLDLISEKNHHLNPMIPSIIARLILSSLHIDGADEDLRYMLEQRAHSGDTHPAPLPRTVSTQSHKRYRQKAEGPSYQLILDPTTGSLQAPVRRINGSNKSHTLYALSLHRETRNWHDFYELRETLPPDLQPRRISNNGQLGALASPHAQAGDWLIQFEMQPSHIWLIAREHGEGRRSSIVGQAILPTYYDVCKGGGDCVCIRQHDSNSAEWEFDHDVLDLFALVYDCL